jgi:hypothetical protein
VEGEEGGRRIREARKEGEEEQEKCKEGGRGRRVKKRGEEGGRGRKGLGVSDLLFLILFLDSHGSCKTFSEFLLFYPS